MERRIWRSAEFPIQNRWLSGRLLRIFPGYRWFDLNRWGNTVEELTRALEYEKTTPWGNSMYGNYTTVGPEDVTYPILQLQIDLSNGRLKQNT